MSFLRCLSSASLRNLNCGRLTGDFTDLSPRSLRVLNCERLRVARQGRDMKLLATHSSHVSVEFNAHFYKWRTNLSHAEYARLTRL
jgi:hypothetical protein